MKMLDEVLIRENLEREYLGLILNKPFLLKYAKIKPFYFSNNKLGLMYQQILECYEKYNTIDFTKIMQIHKAFDLTLCTDLLTDTLVNSNYEEKLGFSPTSTGIVEAELDGKNRKVRVKI